MRWRVSNNDAAQHFHLVQIDAIQAELDVVLPAKLALPGSSRNIQLHKVMAITGRRFVTAGATATQQLSGAQAAGKTTGRPRKQPRRTRTKSSRSESDQAAMPLVATDCPNSAAMDRVADAINGNASGSMTAAEVVAFARAASFCNADAILQALPDYMYWSRDDGDCADDLPLVRSSLLRRPKQHAFAECSAN